MLECLWMSAATGARPTNAQILRRKQLLRQIWRLA
jgi:hypothetical protein